MLLIDSQVSQHIDGAIKDGTSLVFQRQLTQVLARTYDVKYADLPFRSLFPVSTEVSEGANTIEYHVYDQVGVAKLIGAYGKDMPRADVHAKLVQSPVRSSGVSFGYTTQEIRAAALGNQPLEQRKANATKRANEELFNRIAFNGDSKSGLPGFLSNPNITITTVPDGAGGDPEWTEKTPDEILSDVNNLFGSIFTLTKMKERPNTLLLPPAQWNYIASTPRSSGDSVSILQWIIQNSPFIASAANIIPVNQMTGSGVGDTDQMCAYDMNPDAVQAHIPMEQKFYAVQIDGLDYTVTSEARTGGVIIYYPLSVATASGI